MSRSTRSTISPARPRPSTTSSIPVQTTKTSVHGAINMLGLAKRLKAPRSCRPRPREVYGDPTVHPQTEDYWGNVNPIGPRSCYDEGKRCAETLFFDYRRQHRLRIKVARIFNTYGPRMHPNDGRVVSNFIVQALQGETITHLRRRLADPLVLLRRRPDRGAVRLMANARRRHRPDQYRQSRRVHHPRAGGNRHRDDRLPIADYAPPAAARRSQTAMPRNLAGEASARMGTQGRAARRARQDDFLFR